MGYKKPEPLSHVFHTILWNVHEDSLLLSHNFRFTKSWLKTSQHVFNINIDRSDKHHLLAFFQFHQQPSRLRDVKLRANLDKPRIPQTCSPANDQKLKKLVCKHSHQQLILFTVTTNIRFSKSSLDMTTFASRALSRSLQYTIWKVHQQKHDK